MVVGKSNLEIGAALSITEGTAKFHVNNILTKLSERIATCRHHCLKRGLASFET